MPKINNEHVEHSDMRSIFICYNCQKYGCMVARQQAVYIPAQSLLQRVGISLKQMLGKPTTWLQGQRANP